VQGEKFLDSLDDVAMPGVILLDGMAMWGPPKSVGLTDLKLWLAGWLQQYGVTVAITATTVTPNSNKVRQRPDCFSVVYQGLGAGKPC
jgi:hypothetical protein